MQTILNMKRVLLTVFFFLLTALMLTYSRESLYFALTGLHLWFSKMIPTLLPFMILSGIMIRMDITEDFVSLFHPLFYLVFRVRRNVSYCILLGFLCGFPMGARIVSDLYERNRLTEKEAEWLLAFCNNIGPIYFVGFVLPTIQRTQILPYLFGMYGLPLLYGWGLRYTKYLGRISGSLSPSREEINRKKRRKTDGIALFFHVDESINNAAAGITSLGGYMILFNLLNLLPHIFFLWFGNAGNSTKGFLSICNGFLEITSGIFRMGADFPLIVLLLLPFGGLSCIAQTYSMIKKTNLSLQNYVLHKVALSLFTGLYYLLWYFFSRNTFLL